VCRIWSMSYISPKKKKKRNNRYTDEVFEIPYEVSVI
jgi:hypothetical protein